MTPGRLTRKDMDAIATRGGSLPPGFYAVVALGLLALAAFGAVLL